MKAIQEWLGHSNFSTTANLYAHLDFDSKMESANVVASVLLTQKNCTKEQKTGKNGVRTGVGNENGVASAKSA